MKGKSSARVLREQRNYYSSTKKEAARIENQQNYAKLRANQEMAELDAKTSIALTGMDNSKSVTNTQTMKNVALVAAAGICLALIVKFSK